MLRHKFAAILAVLCAVTSARAEVLVSEKGQFGPEPQSETRRFEFDVPKDASGLWLDTSVVLEQGQASVQVLDPGGKKIYDAGTGGQMKLSNQSLKTDDQAGTFQLVHLSGLLGRISTSWIELAIAPAALVSIPLLLWCVRNWPPASPLAAEQGIEADSSLETGAGDAGGDD
ncbi:MAG: hypothetical protein ACOY3P_26700 [Planctomycetota bacterium]